MRDQVRSIAAGLVTVQSVSGTRRTAIRAMTAVLVSLLVLLGLGHVEWALYTTFGAFTAVYGGSAPFTGRWRIQTRYGLLLTAAVVSGALVGLVDWRAWLGIPVVAAWAGLGAHLSDRWRTVPPGPIFVVFATGACAAAPTTPSLLPVALLAAGATAAFAVLLGVVDEWLARLPAEPHHGRSRLEIDPDRVALQLVRVVVAVALSGLVSTAVGIGHPYWAMVAAVVPLSVPGLHAQAVRGLQRGLGTVLGLVVAALLLSLALPELAVVVLVVLLQGAAELLVVRNYAAAMVCITPLALVMGHLAHPEPAAALVADRFIETLIGLTLGLAAAWLTRARPAAA